MNRQIVQLFGLATLLFATLVVFTSRWAVFEQDELENKTSNRRPLIEELRIPRGVIRTSDGTVVARSVPRGSGSRRIFRRTYPTGPLFSHAVGYSFIERDRTGLEKARNDELTGKENEFASIFSQLMNEDREGEDLTTTLDTRGQRAAIAALGGRRGSVVALEPQTGRVRVMVSVPAYDPNDAPDNAAFRRITTGEGSPILNRATQARYPPGSTFKVVTAAAALDSGKFTPTSVVDGSSPKTVSGVPLANAGGQSFGTIPLTVALTNSVNTVWAQVGESIGRGTLVDYMERFGFNQDPPIDYPDEQMSASGIRNAKGRLVEEGFDTGRVAIGQGGQEGAILVTPLQMAMVAGAVGNGGSLMRPQLTERVVAKDGRVSERIRPVEQSRVMSEKAAGLLAQMMSNVVKEGTGTAAALSGIQVAGKTGTAEVDNATANQAWFIGFAPVERPRMAIAVTIERTSGQGGTEAAPVAKQVLQRLIGGGG